MAQTFKPLAALKRYLATPEQPVSTEEMSEFWGSCTDEEKVEFKAYAEEHLKDEAG
jgi:hypothetical protein